MACMGGCTSILVGKPYHKRQIRRYKPKCEDNIKRDFKETEYEDMDEIQLIQDMVHRQPFVKIVMKCQNELTGSHLLAD